MHNGADLYWAGFGAESLLLLSVSLMSITAYLGLTLSQCPRLWLPNKGYSSGVYSVLHFRHSPARTTEVSGKDNPLWIYTEICEGQIYTQYVTFTDVENSK